MTENDISRVIVDVAYKIHTTLGPGLLESVYETVMEYELKARGLSVERQRGIPVVYDGMKLDDGFRADLIVNGRVIIELKSVELLPPVAFKILKTYLRLTDMRLGILINFGEALIKDGIHRVANGMPD